MLSPHWNQKYLDQVLRQGRNRTAAGQYQIGHVRVETQHLLDTFKWQVYLPMVGLLTSNVAQAHIREVETDGTGTHSKRRNRQSKPSIHKLATHIRNDETDSLYLPFTNWPAYLSLLGLILTPSTVAPLSPSSQRIRAPSCVSTA